MSGDAPPWICLDGLSAGYRGAPRVIDSLTLAVPASARILCLTGPSGVGKSTLLAALAGFKRPFSGVVALDGEIVRAPGPRRPFAPQNGALFPWLTALDNVAFGLKARGVPARARRAQALAWLERFGLAHAADLRPGQLSGGMAKRVALARALVLRPPTVLLDEPFSGLDRPLAEEIETLISGLAAADAAHFDKGAAATPPVRFVIASHDLESCAYLADGVLALCPGAAPVYAAPPPAPHPRPPRFRESAAFTDRLNLMRKLARQAFAPPPDS